MMNLEKIKHPELKNHINMIYFIKYITKSKYNPLKFKSSVKSCISTMKNTNYNIESKKTFNIIYNYLLFIA